MLNIEITETKNFVKKLLMEPVFDTFLLVEAYVRSDVSVSGFCIHIFSQYFRSYEYYLFL